ncbi:hypothetical protein LDENG_00238780 [Lucifuga dentata]|nr:hypothetical protein LDENG_00238780 [Lucifuga dentata]
MAAAAIMDAADVAVVGAYFLLVLAIGLLSMRKSNRSTLSGYFLAGRSVGWAAAGASLFVSNIGSHHFIGLAGSGAASGLAVAAWEFSALLVLQLLGWIFIPIYIQAGVFTMPEYLAKRYGGKRLKVYFASLTLLLYLFTKLSVDLYAGALFIQESLGWNLYLSVILLIAMTALLTVTGGLVAVIYTDSLQAVIMVCGALSLAAISLLRVGGLEGMNRKYMQASPNVTAILLSSPNLTYAESCYRHLAPKPDALEILRGPADPDLPWPGFLLGQIPASIWYWCTDQVLVQCILAAKNSVHAKAAIIMAGFLKILPMFIIVMPGMISRIFFADDLACVGPQHCAAVCGSESGCSNVAYPRLVMAVMPAGLRGQMMAVLIAALMSDLDSIFNSASTVFTLDLYKMLRKGASSGELLLVGRLFVVFMVPVIIQMYYFIQEIIDYLTPPIAALFLLGVLWRRCNESGAFWGGMVSLVLGLSRLILTFVYHEPLCDRPDERPAFIKDVHFMYVAAILVWVPGLVMVVVSLCTPPPETEQIRSTTVWGLKQRRRLKQEAEGEPLEPLRRDGADGKSENCPNNTDPAAEAQTQRPTPHGCHATTSPEEEEEEGAARREEEECGRSMKVVECLCGLQQEASQVSSEHQSDVDELLHETPRTRILLNAGLLLVCFIGLFLLIYFSL